MKMMPIALLAGLLVSVVTAAEAEKGTLTLEELTSVQPGLGTVMLEYSHRFYVLYYAAKAGNWDLAAYELEEQREIQEVAETTRPMHAVKLRAFEKRYLSKLQKAVDRKSWSEFEPSYFRAVDGCNLCHAETGHPYIRYRLPERPPAMLEMTPSKKSE